MRGNSVTNQGLPASHNAAGAVGNAPSSVTNQGLPASHNGVVLISVDPPSVTNQGLPPSPKKYGYFMAFAQQAFTYQT